MKTHLSKLALGAASMFLVTSAFAYQDLDDRLDALEKECKRFRLEILKALLEQASLQPVPILLEIIGSSLVTCSTGMQKWGN